eukprot:TRINITY_DN7016_c0_g1_i2.p1 TRINITY_DN7016_c0_g1~~TRINITY_DN7016_c0_g1_i2.p1  ORF type:complete len:258 (+),score=71.75 TRINITY_DN7016_c0_g1_i2:134-907(+)
MRSHFRSGRKGNLLAPDLYTRRWKFYNEELKMSAFKKNVGCTNGMLSRTRELRTDFKDLNKSAINETSSSQFIDSITEGYKGKHNDLRMNRIEELTREVFARINRKKEKYDPEDVDFSFIKKKLLRKHSIPESSPKQKSIFSKRLKEKKNSDLINEDYYEFVLPHIQENDNDIKGRYIRLISKKSTSEHLPIIKPILRLNNVKNEGNRSDLGTYIAPLRKRSGEVEEKGSSLAGEEPKLSELCRDINNMLKVTKYIA